MSTIDEVLDLLNAKVQFRAPEGVYEGLIGRVYPISGKVRVQQVTFVADKVTFGSLFFRFIHFKILKVITPPPPKIETEEVEEITHRLHLPSRNRDFGLFDDYLTYSDEENEEQECEEEKYAHRIPPRLSHVLSSECEIIDSIDERFFSSIEHIRDQENIGLCLEGPDVSRHGELSFLNIATRRRTLLFDIKALGKDAFSHGLRSVLQDYKIVKVIHDSRQASDCLYNKYKTRLVNVFDTQVGDLFYRMVTRNDGKALDEVCPLNICLAWYMEIPDEFLRRHRQLGVLDNGSLYFGARPVKHELLGVMVHNVIYLLLLRREVEMGMNTPFQRAVGVYLSSIQALSDRELVVERHVPEKAPKELFEEEIKIVRFKEHIDVHEIAFSGPPYRKSVNSMENVLNCYSKLYKNFSSDASRRGSDSDGSSSTSQDSKYGSDPENKFDALRETFPSLLRETKSSNASSSSQSSHSSQTHKTVQHSSLTTETEEKLRIQNLSSSHQKPSGSSCSVQAVNNCPVALERNHPECKPLGGGMGRGALLLSLLHYQSSKSPGVPDVVSYENEKPKSDNDQQIDWSAVRSQFDDADPYFSEKKIRFVPAGMGC